MKRLAPPFNRPLLVIAAFLLVAACRKELKLPPDVVATLGSRQIILDDYRRYLERNAGTELSQTPPAAASALLDQYLEEVLLSEYSVAHHGEIPADQVAPAVRNDPGSTVVEKKDDLRRSRLLADITAAAHQPNDAEIDAYYRQNQAEFRAGERVAVRQILVHDEQVAQQILRELKQGASFQELSMRFSSAPNSRSGGEIGFVGRGQLPRVFEDEIFRLDPGQFSGLVRTNDSFHIFLVEARRPEGVLTREESGPLIRGRLADEAVRRELARTLDVARKEFRIAVHSGRLPFPYSGAFPAVRNE
jgi:hypothetical protein